MFPFSRQGRGEINFRFYARAEKLKKKKKRFPLDCSLLKALLGYERFFNLSFLFTAAKKLKVNAMTTQRSTFQFLSKTMPASCVISETKKEEEVE